MSRETQERLMRERQRQAYLARKRIKKERKRKVIRFIIFILVFIFAFVFYENGFSLDLSNFKWKGFNVDIFKKKEKEQKTKTESYKSSMAGEVVAYVPIDDRPIHTTRIEYLARSAGFELKMPEAKNYRTHIGTGENSYAEYNTKYGNPAKISSWLVDLDKEGCDYFIISLDQMFSGGLVSSQYISDEEITIYGQKMDYYKKVIESLLADANNHIYIIDSITGLSITPGFMGLTEEDYQNILAYSNVERKTLETEELSIDNIVKEYKLDKTGQEIQTTEDEIILNKYLDARKRKLEYSTSLYEIMDKRDNKNVHIYYGIEDSGNHNTNIQKNDIAYIKKVAQKHETSITMREGVSTLSELAFADMQLDAVTAKVKVKVSYYGDENRTVPGTNDSYKEYMSHIIKDLGMKEVNTKQNFEILVYNTKEDGKNEETSNKLIQQYLDNIHNKVPTVIINDADLTKDKYLVNNLSNYESTQVPLGYLIGYSNWNGFKNSARIGVAEGVTRFLYLKGNTNKRDDMDKGFLMTMGLSFIEDMGYLSNYDSSLEIKELELLMDAQNKMILDNLSNSNYISDLNPYEEKGIRHVTISNYTFPWDRKEEISVKLYGAIQDRHSITVPKTVSYQK